MAQELKTKVISSRTKRSSALSWLSDGVLDLVRQRQRLSSLGTCGGGGYDRVDLDNDSAVPGPVEVDLVNVDVGVSIDHADEELLDPLVV